MLSVAEEQETGFFSNTIQDDVLSFFARNIIAIWWRNVAIHDYVTVKGILNGLLDLVDCVVKDLNFVVHVVLAH